MQIQFQILSFAGRKLTCPSCSLEGGQSPACWGGTVSELRGNQTWSKGKLSISRKLLAHQRARAGDTRPSTCSADTDATGSPIPGCQFQDMQGQSWIVYWTTRNHPLPGSERPKQRILWSATPYILAKYELSVSPKAPHLPCMCLEGLGI